MPPLFSILVPLYNHERYISAALDTLLAQTDPDWEALVVDDGSTDNSGSIAEAYARRDSRIRVLHKTNGGQSTALNAGIRASRGEWICWLSSDDLFKPDKLAVHARCIADRRDVMFQYTDFDCIDDLGRPLQSGSLGEPPEDRWWITGLFDLVRIYGVSVCIHRSVFDRCGLFDEANRFAQDYDFWLRSCAHYIPHYMPVVTCTMRSHAGQCSKTEAAAMFYDCSLAAVAFAGRTSFAEWFPFADLDDHGVAREAVDRAIDMAVSMHAFVNQIGVHPTVAMRTMEWVWGLRDKMLGSRLRRLFAWRARAAAESMAGAPHGAMWRAIGAIAAASPDGVDFMPVSMQDVTDAAYLDLAASGDASAESMRAYIEGRQRRCAPARPPVGHEGRDVLIAGDVRDEIVCAWAKAGWRVTRLRSDTQGVRMQCWGWEIGTRSTRLPLAWALACVPPWDAAVGNVSLVRTACRSSALGMNGLPTRGLSPCSRSAARLRAWRSFCLTCMRKVKV